MEQAKRIPYGVSDFVDIIERNQYYVDKTMYLPMLEDEADSLFFIRPRRFGKSLFRRIFFIITFLAISLNASSQSSKPYIYELKKASGHYFFDATVGGFPVKDIMVESGIPGLLIGDSLFRKCFSDIEGKYLRRENGKRIRLLNDAYAISHILPLTCRIGEGEFTGNVFVLEGYDGVALPVQSFASTDPTKKYLRIDLSRNQMCFIGERDWEDKADYNAYRLERIDGMPTIETDVSITSQNASGTIAKSKYIIDFGNGSLLFLMKGNEDVDQMIASSGIEIQNAADKEGRIVAEGIFADSCTICGRTFEQASIGLTDKMKSFHKFSGLIGLKFFTRPVVLDFSDNRIYISRQ